MKSIHTIAEVDKHGNVIISVGREYAGCQAEASIQVREQLSREEWVKRLDEAAGSIDDPTFRRPSQIPGFRLEGATSGDDDE